MSQNAAKFTGSIPEFYDRYLGPHIFTDFADDLAGHVAAHSPLSVLELAAGTGVATQALRKRLPAAVLTATDLNQAMLDIAQKKIGSDVTFRAADAQELPFPDGAFDAVACQFGVMFFPDKDRSYREVLRVLAPGGHYHFNVWDAFSFNPFGRIAHETLATFFTSDPPRFYLTPFGYHTLDPIKESLQKAGFAEIKFHVISRTKDIPDAGAFARGLVMGNPAIEDVKSRATQPTTVVVDGVAAALRQEFGSDPGSMPIQAIFVSGRKPS